MTSGVQHGMTGAVVFQREQLVRFGHCDPAGIVFYPRYFEMLNELVEDWFAQGLGQSFARLITESGLGMPTAQLDTRFLRISRLGDVLQQRLRLQRVGGSSMTLAVSFDGDDGPRVEFGQDAGQPLCSLPELWQRSDLRKRPGLICPTYVISSL